MTAAAIDQQSRLFAPSKALSRAWRTLALGITLLTLTLTGCSFLPVSQVPATGASTQVVSTAFKMLGRPYRFGGSTPSGFDCSGLVQFSFQQAGLNVPRTALEQYERSTPVPDNRLQPGDLLFFTLNSRRVAHVGIYVGDGKFIHAPAIGKQVMESRLDEPFWHGHLVRAGRLF
jgi:cell wall-associated NlpC family hydrolase